MEITPRAPIYTSIKITCATDGATILYRIGNNAQYFESQEEIKSFIDESPIEYSQTIQVPDTMNLYVYAKKTGMLDSDAVHWKYGVGIIT